MEPKNHVNFKRRQIEGIHMTLFGERLSEIETKLLKNTRKSKAIFPEEIQIIESGLELMLKLTQILNENIRELWKRPNLVTNINLFARNRQLLLNAYICWLNSSYGTHFVISRTVLENNNLMRHFNENYQHAFEWLSLKIQNRFVKEIRTKYGTSKKHNEKFWPSPVMDNIFEGKLKVKCEIKELYAGLCNYTHPNFKGWHELFGTTGKTEIILRTPIFQPNNSEKTIALTLYLMQLSFKTFIETFREYLDIFKYELDQWQENYLSLIRRYE